MHVIYALARFFPFWALPVALIMGEIGIYFRRRANPKQWACWMIVGSLTLLSILWFVFRGDLYSDRWVRSIVG